MVLWAASSLSMSQQHILNKVSVDRNMHKTKYVRYDKNVTRGSQEPNLISSSSNGSVFANSEFVVTF